MNNYDFIKIGNKVFWHDPDGGLSDGVYQVVDVPEEIEGRGQYHFDSLGLFRSGSIRSGTVAAVIFFRWHIGVARYAACSANPFIRFVENLPFVFVKYHILLYPFIAFIHTVSISGKPVSLFYTAGPLSSPGHSCCHRPLVLSDAKVGSRA